MSQVSNIGYESGSVSEVNDSMDVLHDSPRTNNGDHSFAGTPTDISEKDENFYTMFDEIWDHSQNHINQTFDPLKNSYGYLKMTFSEMTEVMKGNLSLRELDDVKPYLSGVTNELMKRVHEKKNGTNGMPQGSIISSNTIFKKNFKTHSTGFL